ncbi:ISL3 family transposase [Spirosoma daeguense]
MAHAQRSVAMMLGGKAGSQLLDHLYMPTSHDTLLRLIRKWQPGITPTPHALGVDDWAIRKAKTYGTILVDLDRHQPIDLLEGRTAEGLRDWLKAHPGVEVITRDRSGEYARGAREGAPQAQQVADRWHLLQNMEQVLERLLTGCYQRLRQLPVSQTVPTTQPMTERLNYVMRDYSKNELEARLAGREKRVGYFNQIQQLRQAGLSISKISRKLAMNRSTVRRYAYAESFPERVQRPTGRSMLTPYIAYLENRYQQGCRNAQQLWRELGQQGYPGAHNQVTKWLSRRRNEEVPMTQKQAVTNSSAPDQPSFELPTTQQLAWLMVRPVSLLEEADRQILNYVCQDAIIAQVYELVRDFGAMVRVRRPELLDDWLVRCQTCSAVLLQQFSLRLHQDYAAVRAALATAWSNAQTEGQVTRVKLIKRQMYGRAKLDLLRQRVLYRYSTTQSA